MGLIYQINRSKRRRTLALKVANGQLQVHAPWFVRDAEIEQFVAQKRSWIERHLSRQQSALAGLTPRDWLTENSVLWLGQPVVVTVHYGGRGGVMRFTATELQISVPNRVKDVAGYIFKCVRQAYKERAMAWLNEFFDQQSQLPQYPKAWSIGQFKAKWGHCSKAGELKFTWQLWLAPEWVVRYVVLHEVAHLDEFNHGPKFWQRVAELEPDYRHAEAWLKRHGMTVLSLDYLDYVVA
ncbi:M48 family metallopeptidase [Pseudidiomarina taiwanensis]|uniref:YgjP-like metallopeptidase domain-containing protein n=1 Tax=Pseudidiomarina taiwanensis TaxID=337250 RepID=A0A432ZFW1_9GAMM|nr:SprT family zinc-dependent metalloprotease [Pseudidiomarina taiwanensis]RUO76811.1 hypothetical protein CWI83_07765 [Pseudidiomarina taiwanensis]